jgi:hypothetical protein
VSDRRKFPKLLVVEGQDDKFSVIGLMEHHIEWPDRKEECPVYIEVGSSADEVLKQGYLTAQIKASHVKTFGVMLDADAGAEGRYQRIRHLCSQLFPLLPAEIDSEGLITSNDDDKRFGVWLMPDNVSHGCLETLLKFLVPDAAEATWKHTVDSVERARALGAPCRDSHLAKAELYTWLAWQDPPGYSPGRALTKKVLDPASAHAVPFVNWFKNLYQL